MTHVTCRLTAWISLEPGSAPEPYARYSSMGYLLLLVKYSDSVGEIAHLHQVSPCETSAQLLQGGSSAADTSG